MPAIPSVIRRSNVDWTNHHLNVRVRVAERLTIEHAAPGSATYGGMRDTATRIQQVIGEALAAGSRIRTCGARWSFSDLPVASGCWMIETDQLQYRIRVKPEHMDQQARLTANDVLLAQCGVKVSLINEAFETRAWQRALRTSGASNGQTVGGMIGTGVHGSAIDVGGFESQVAGVQLLTANRNLWIERASRPVMSSDWAAKLGATLVRDDQLFEAAIVNLGALGVVHAVLLESTGRYRLDASLLHIPYGQIQNTLNTLNFETTPQMSGQPQRPYFFQAIVNPGRFDIAYTAVRYKRPCPPTYTPLYDMQTGYEPGTDLPRLIASVVSMVGGARDPLTRLLVKLADELRVRADKESDWKTPGESYTFTNAREGIASCGFAIPVAQTTTALDIARRAFSFHASAPVLFTCRYAQKSPAIMGFTRYDPTCIFDIDGVDTPQSHALIERVARDFDAAGMPYAMHWGKTHFMTSGRIRRAFGGDVDRWNAARRRLLPDQAERNAFSTPVIDAWGLNA
jgi:hypothetical protein